ncbi:MAG: ribosome biogenesis GTPase Der [Alphaproteobacteria bacterium]|nr:ribosome biogenesis GTPase Der [Alphaproteobacteria bacterium]
MFTIAIVGRPNVGKSTLFNRLAKKKLAIVDDTPGVTRDWREAEGWLLGEPVRIIDTAGLEESFDESIQGRMRRQTEHALEHADAVLFVVDGRAGLTPTDGHFATWVRKTGKPVALAVNKCENEAAAEAGMAEAWSLGLGEPIPISAAHGHGIEDIYHAFAPYFPPDEPETASVAAASQEGRGEGDSGLDAIEGVEDFEFEDVEEEKAVKIAIVGRPNVGKSTLLNAILKDERVMTGPEAGVTRDAIAVDWDYDGRKVRLVDTAGLRRKSKIDRKLERMAVEDSMRAIRLAQVVVLVVDGNMALEKQDLAIAQHIIEEGRAMVLAVNKWDSVGEKKEILLDIDYKLQHSLAQLKNVPMLTLSALKGTNIDKLMRTVLDAYGTWNARIPTAKLNRWLAMATQAYPPPLSQGRPNKVRYMTQIKTRPPTFAVWVSRPQDFPDTYRRYLINGLREQFGIGSVPVRLLVRTSKNPYV